MGKRWEEDQPCGTSSGLSLGLPPPCHSCLAKTPVPPSFRPPACTEPSGCPANTCNLGLRPPYPPTKQLQSGHPDVMACPCLSGRSVLGSRVQGTGSPHPRVSQAGTQRAAPGALPCPMWSLGDPGPQHSRGGGWGECWRPWAGPDFCCLICAVGMRPSALWEQAHSGSVSGNQVQGAGWSQTPPRADLGPLGASLVSPSVCLTEWGRHVTTVIEG